jgi:putative membrane protein
MPWLKILHVSAVIAWAGTLLYMPLLIAAASPRSRASREEGLPFHLLRGVFVNLATPAALLAIGSGTAIFLWSGLLAHWLMVKLALVGLLVLGHALCGMLLLRVERGEPLAAGVTHGVMVLSLLWLAAIAWLVLRKPF